MHSQLESYLKEMEAKLRSLPEEQRESDIAEIHQHLESMIAAYKEMDCADGEAVALAIQQFGPPKAIAGKLLNASRRAGMRQIGSRLCFAGWSLFLISLLLPTTTIFGATLRGYHCALFVLHPTLPMMSQEPWGYWYYHGLGLANILMVASPMILSALKGKRPLWIASLLLATSAMAITPLLFSAGWAVGFYVWWASFGLVAAGSVSRAHNFNRKHGAIVQ